MTSGFVGSPPPVNGRWADSQAEAWRIYRESPEEFGYPMQVGDRWLVPRPVGVVNAQLAAEAHAVHRAYGPILTPTPGSSKERARLKPEDRKRISEQVARRRRAEVEREERVEQVRQAALF